MISSPSELPAWKADRALIRVAIDDEPGKLGRPVYYTVPSAYVERSVGAWSSSFSSDHGEGQSIGRWAVTTSVTGVVWTAPGPSFAGRPVKPSCDQVIRYFADLEGARKSLPQALQVVAAAKEISQPDS